MRPRHGSQKSQGEGSETLWHLLTIFAPAALIIVGCLGQSGHHGKKHLLPGLIHFRTSYRLLRGSGSQGARLHALAATLPEVAMQRREFMTALGGAATAWPLRARAQPAGKIPRVGWIILGSPTGGLTDIFSYFDSFRAGLSELGYVEGKNIILIPRSALGVPEALPGLIDEMSRENVSVIVSPGPAIRVVREKVKTIPVVFAFSGDPVAAGFVDTLSHGKGNLTGLSYMAVELNGKRLDLMKEILPTVSRVTLLTNPIHPGEHLEVAESQRVAAALGMSLQYLQVRTPAEFDAAFQAMSDSKTEGIVAVPDNLIMLERTRLAEFARDRKIPVISGWGEFAVSGGLLTYGPNSRKFFRRLAGYVQKILSGASPGEIPVEQPTTFELVINLKTAKSIGLTIPATLFGRADEVIE
jgi:putative tryptophan/tyrosine transport system substrate-binding protein